jgi:uncharacterized membrane protein YhaH (DUF805 family)
MDWIYLFTSFSGRISRQPFWIGFGILFAAELATQQLASRAQEDTLATILDLAFAYPEFALAVKRTNDRNLSPWVFGFFLAINVALGLFTLLNGNLDANNPINDTMAYLLGFFALVLLIELGFRRGTSGPNRFGSDPLADGAPTFLGQYSMVRWLNWWLEGLKPAEPFFLGDWTTTPNYSEEPPRSVKYWCVTITVVNAVIFVVESLILRSIRPAVVFVLLTAIGPGSFVLWRRTVRHLNRNADALQAMAPLSVKLSLEWCAIFALLAWPLVMILFCNLGPFAIAD